MAKGKSAKCKTAVRWVRRWGRHARKLRDLFHAEQPGRPSRPVESFDRTHTTKTPKWQAKSAERERKKEVDGRVTLWLSLTATDKEEANRREKGLFPSLDRRPTGVSYRTLTPKRGCREERGLNDCIPIWTHKCMPRTETNLNFRLLSLFSLPGSLSGLRILPMKYRKRQSTSPGLSRQVECSRSPGAVM